MSSKVCSACLKEIPPHTGYGRTNDEAYVCYPCGAEIEKQHMVDKGNTTLYYHMDKDGNKYVANWTNLLKFRCLTWHEFSIRSFERQRITVTFVGPDGYIWNGVQKGINNTVFRCTRTKTKGKQP